MAINNVNNNGSKSPIDNQKLSQQQTLNNNNAQAENQKVSSPVVARQDSVSLTQSAQQLSQVQRKGAEAPVNQERVDKLKKAIQNGQYSVNPEALAKKMSTLEAELFGTKA